LGIDWNAVYRKAIPPPFVPASDSTGLKYVDKEFLDMAVANSEVGGGPDVAHFDGFTYKGGY